MNTARKLRTVFEKPKSKLSLVHSKAQSFKKFFKKEEISTQDMVLRVLESHTHIRGKTLCQKVVNMSDEPNLTKAMKQEICAAIEKFQGQGDLLVKGSLGKEGLKNLQLTYKHGKSKGSGGTSSQPATSVMQKESSSMAYSADQQTLLGLFKEVPRSVWKNLSQSQELDKFSQSLCSTLERMSNKRQRPELKQCHMGFEALCQAYEMKLLDEKWFITTLSLDPESLRIYLSDLK